MQEQTPSPLQQVKENRKSRRGFASMDKERHKLVSSKGGKAERISSPAAPTPSTNSLPQQQ